MNLIARSLVPFSLLVATLAWAQDYRGRVQGVVTDPLNAAITDATETVRVARTRLVDLNYRSIWLMQRLGDLREVDPAGGRQMSSWYGEQPGKAL